MFKNFKLISMAVSFVLLFQLNAFALSDDTSGKQPDGEAISGSEIPPELICPTVPPQTPTAITTAIPSPVDDYGDSFDTAYTLKELTEINGEINKEFDKDTFKFVPADDGFFDFYFTNSTSAYIKITDSDGTVLNYTEPNETYTKCYHVFLSKDQVYYAIVSQESYTGGYGLVVIPFTDDYGNFTENADEIEVESTITGALNNIQDTDYFCFIPKESGTYEISFEYGLYNAAILDINEKPIAECSTNNYSNYYSLSQDTKYYIKIWNSSKKTSLYEFSIKFIKDDYGDTFSDSYFIKSNNGIGGSINRYGDNDVFSFTATDKSCHINSNQLSTKNITLYNKSYEIIDKTSSSDTNMGTYNSILQIPVSIVTSDIFYDNLTIGDTYYLKVGGNILPVEYSIRLYPFADDYGNTYDSAQIIKANTLVKGKFDYYTSTNKDIEVFAFIPETSGRYSFDSSLPIKRISIKFEKFEDNSKPSILPTITDETSIPKFELIKDEKYFLTIQYPQKCDYSFTVNGPLLSPTQSPSPTSRTSPKKGDVNDDGQINAVDFALFRMYLLGKYELDGASFVRFPYDINSDSQIDSVDFALLRQYLLGIIDSFIF